MFTLNDLVLCIPHDQDFIIVLEFLESSKYCDLIKQNHVEIKKYSFYDPDDFFKSDYCNDWKDFIVDGVYTYHDSLCIYIYVEK